jgi:hypothetical protein
MTTQGSGLVRSKRAGVVAAVLGLLGLAGFLWMWAVTATPMDPPEWARIVGIWLLPIGIVGALVAGIPNVRGPGRAWAVVGLVAAAVALIGAVLLITLWPY